MTKYRYVLIFLQRFENFFEFVWDLRGQGGGSEVKFCFQLYFINSENLEYVALGTFYRSEKALFVAEMGTRFFIRKSSIRK